MERQKIIIVILAAGLFLLGQYIVLDRWLQSKQQEIENNLQSDHSQGIKDAIIALYEQTNDCHVTTIKFGNLTRSLLDISCLQVTNYTKH